MKEPNRGTGQKDAGNKIICFDCDGTLLDYSGKPRSKVIDTLLLFVRAGWSVYVWSGGGVTYAQSVGRSLKLPESEEYTDKVNGVRVDGRKVVPDIAVDDQRVSLGKRNVFVGKDGW